MWNNGKCVYMYIFVCVCIIVFQASVPTELYTSPSLRPHIFTHTHTHTYTETHKYKKQTHLIYKGKILCWSKKMCNPRFGFSPQMRRDTQSFGFNWWGYGKFRGLPCNSGHEIFISFTQNRLFLLIIQCRIGSL